MSYDQNGIPVLSNAGVNEPVRTKLADIKVPTDLQQSLHRKQ